MRNDVVLVLVVITALAFDFTNGFHDTGNAMATSIATGALPPRVAVALSGLLNLVGAFLSLAVAATIANGLVNTADVTLPVVAAGLAGGIIWNLITWLFGIPSSSSHALIGGVIGSTLAAAGGSAVLWKGLVSKVVIPAALSPIIAALVAALSYWLAHGIGGSLGVFILLAVLVGLSGAIYWRSRATKVDHSNVNDEWTGGVAPAEPEPAAAV